MWIVFADESGAELARVGVPEAILSHLKTPLVPVLVRIFTRLGLALLGPVVVSNVAVSVEPHKVASFAQVRRSYPELGRLVVLGTQQSQQLLVESGLTAFKRKTEAFRYDDGNKRRFRIEPATSAKSPLLLWHSY